MQDSSFNDPLRHCHQPSTSATWNDASEPQRPGYCPQHTPSKFDIRTSSIFLCVDMPITFRQIFILFVVPGWQQADTKVVVGIVIVHVL